MYYLILIVSLVSNGSAVSVEEITFQDERSCQAARVEIIHSYDKSPISSTSERKDADMYIDAFCVKK